MAEDESCPHPPLPPPPPPPRRFMHWMRHTAAVPKGFLRFQVLELLDEKPLSGSEIINEVARRTNGHWKPSPGSIYPLLAWLQDNGYLKEMPIEEGGIKRYKLSDKGKKLLEEQRKIKSKFKEEGKFFSPPFFGALLFRIPPEKTAKTRESMRRLITTFFELGINLEKNFSEKTVDEVNRILEETVKELEKVNKRLKE